MRILLAQNAPYYPAHGGGDKSNRLLLEALAARGHTCQAVARTAEFGPRAREEYLVLISGADPLVCSRPPGRPLPSVQEAEAGAVIFDRRSVEAHIVTLGNQRGHLVHQIATFRPDIILASTDDPTQSLLTAALASSARVVYLVRATLAVPFGPDSAFPSAVRTARIREADRVVCVSRYVANYVRRHAAIDAIHVPISLLEPEAAPDLGRFENTFVTMVNPCAVKGIAIFLALADAFPNTAFAAVPTWGAIHEDRAELAARPNITVLDPVDNIDRLFERTRVLLVPSLWAEARSRIVMEALARGVPVLAADVGGIPEAMLGVPGLLPVNPIVKYQPKLDERMVPVAEVPPQNIAPWREALNRLLTDPAHYREIAAASRQAALAHAASLNVLPFEALLEEVIASPLRRASSARAGTAASLSPEKRQLLALRLRRQAPPSAWFPDLEQSAASRLFCFPHAGAGASTFAAWKIPDISLVPVRFPGRESRSGEAPFERMAALVAALADAMASVLDRPFAFFGHSLGAIVAFELTRELRRRGLPEPYMLIASGARAPSFRRNHVAPADPSDAELLAELRALGGTPAALLEDPSAVRAILPALRADTGLYRRYAYLEESPLSNAICAYGGAEDIRVTEAHLAAWGGETTGPFRVRRFPGGHFYLQPPTAQFLAALADDLRRTT